MNADDLLKRQYQGFKNTHLLWEDELMGLKQFVVRSKTQDFNASIDKRLRLGHIVEHFVEFEFEDQKEIEILGRNIQIYSDKRTIGEFDFIVEKGTEVYHIEVVYKFYLFDETVGESEIEHWIGPNRNDSLDQKIEKIKSNQFPLIDHPKAIKRLAELGIENAIQQRVYFKGKLFIPFEKYQSDKKPKIELLNSNCVSGFYIRFNELEVFKNHEIYIPTKHDWLVEPFTEVEWMNYDASAVELSIMMAEKRAPLIWFKDEDGNLTQGFVVWWD